jgi:type I restriction enzyme, S subunit
MSVAELANGQRAQFNDGDWIETPHITLSGNRLLQTGNIGVGSLKSRGTQRYISDESFTSLKCKEVVPGDLLICRLADPAGRACLVPDIGERRMLTSVDVTIYRPDPRRADRRFLVAVFSMPSWFQSVSDRCAGSTRTRIPRSELGRIKIRLPSVVEQARIAEAFSDADESINILERLVAKKRAIKQGMMQLLLTGRTRLPGFTDPWTDTHLGAVAQIKTGSRNNQDKQAQGRFPFFVRSAIVERIDSYSYDCEAILVPGEGGIGSIFHYIKGKFEVHQRVYKVSDFGREASGRFLYHYMRHFFGVHAMENSVKATVDSLRLPTFIGFELHIPCVEEQRAIAVALDNADTQILVLEQKLSKAKMLKAGMLQQLLTGRIRLPVMEPAS